jgi:hypothetical protein
MRLKLTSIFFLLVLVSFAFGASSGEVPASITPGKIRPPNGKYESLITISEGECRKLTVYRNESKPILVVNDITGIIWIDKNTLLYSVSPIYGDKPGIYLLSCSIGKVQTIVPSKHYDKDYHGFTDYFELKSYSPEITTVFFYYSKDVDKTDFKNFRTERYLNKLDLSNNKVEKLK